MNRSVANEGTPPWGREPVTSDVIEVAVLAPGAPGGVGVWKATRVRGTNAATERIYTDLLAGSGSVSFRDFGRRWRWPKMGRRPKDGDEVEFYSVSRKEWTRERVDIVSSARCFAIRGFIRIAFADEGWLWRWPPPKPKPVVQPPADRVSKPGDTVYIVAHPHEKSYAATVDRSERFPGRGGARFCIQGMDSWFYQDERGAFWDWEPPDTGTVQKAAVDKIKAAAATPPVIQGTWTHFSHVRVDVQISEIRRALNLPDLPERAQCCRTQDAQGNDVLRFHWEEKK